MAEAFSSPVQEAVVERDGVRLTDESRAPKWRTWEGSAPLGRALPGDRGLEFSISPGEWIVVGAEPGSAGAVDLTHVRAMFRLGGTRARDVLEHVCAIDLSDQMTPDLAAARTLVAGVATEVVRSDDGGEPSYLLLMSRSFARHVWDRLVAAGSRP